MTEKLSRKDDDINSQNYYDLAHKLEKRILILEYEIENIKKELENLSDTHIKVSDKQDIHIDKIIDNINTTDKKVNEYILKTDIKVQEWSKFLKIVAAVIGGLISLGFAIVQVLSDKT